MDLARFVVRWCWRAAAVGRSPEPTGCPRVGSRSSSPATVKVATARSKAAKTIANKTPAELEDRVVRLRKDSPIKASTPARRRSTTTSR